MIKSRLSALALALAASASFAGEMGPMPTPPSQLLFIEAGLSYSHAFYKDRIITPESYTVATPNGFAFDPSDYYPNDFWGGYIGASWYSNNWMLNTRLDMYSNEEQHNELAETRIRLTPVRLTFTADYVMGDINQLSYGVGAGAVIESINEGSFIVVPAVDNPPSESINNTRIDPAIEAFVMYRMDNNIGFKFNVAYQIPLHSRVSNGDLNLNLGINYAFNV